MVGSAPEFPSGTVAVVLGSSGFLGSALMDRLSEAGLPCLGVDMQGTATNVDLTDPTQLRHMLSDFLNESPDSSNVVLTVATGRAVFTDTTERTFDEISGVLMTNVGIPLFALNEVRRACIDRGISGSFVLISSVFAKKVPQFDNYQFSERRSSEVYGASKAALEQMVRYYASVLGPEGLRVNGLAPGGIFDESTHSTLFTSSYSKDAALGRMSDRAEVVDGIFFLLSDRSRGITGHTLAVDCGYRL